MIQLTEIQITYTVLGQMSLGIASIIYNESPRL